MFIIGEAVIDTDVARERFACDLDRCHGACCTLAGGRGAPLDDDELMEISRAYPEAKAYLSQPHRDAIDRLGMFEGTPGNFATVCIDRRDCVFVFYEEGTARCALEKAYLEGKTKWRKPLSCHLFPIRSSHGVSPRLRYEKISECKPAVERGRRENVPLYEFLRDPLTRKFGEQWYADFLAECRQRDTRNAQS